MKDQCECGRPLFNGKDVELTLSKLEAAFSIGCTDEEACLQADISVDALYRYERENLEFRKRKVLLKEKLILIARSNFSKVMTEVDASNNPTPRALEMSKWYAERKRKAEFSTLNANLNDTPENPLTPERMAQIDGAMHAWDSDGEEEDMESDYEVEHESTD